MRAWLILVFLFVTESCKSGVGVPILEHVGRDSVTNQWFLSQEQIDRAPRWDPLKGGAPPFSIPDAVRVASAWLGGQRATNRSVFIWEPPNRVNKIEVRFLLSEDLGFRGVCYYVLFFETGNFDNRACIVLMDGRVLEPEVKGEGRGSVRESAIGCPRDDRKKGKSQ